MNSEKTICIIDHYSSEPRYGGILRQYNFANTLSKNGYNVIVIASSFSHFTHSFFSQEKVLVNELKPNFHYVYLRTIKYQSNNGMRRLISMIDFLLKVLANERNIFKKYGKPNVVIGSSVHPFAWLAAEKISIKYSSLFCADVRDFWPRIWIESGEKGKNNPLSILMTAIQKRTFKKADKIFYSMKGGDGYICDELGYPKEKTYWLGQPIDCKWFDENKRHIERLPDDIKKFMEDSFVCSFAGYYMTYEGMYVMLRAAKILQDKGLPIKMVFVGTGKEKEGMLSYVKENALDNVLIHSRISKEAVPALLSNSAICLAHLEVKDYKGVYKYGVSKNKVIEYLYSGACTVYGFSYNNEVSESNGGLCFEPYNEIDLANVIEKIYNMPEEERFLFGQRGREYIKKEYDVEVLAKKMESALFLKEQEG